MFQRSSQPLLFSGMIGSFCNPYNPNTYLQIHNPEVYFLILILNGLFLHLYIMIRKHCFNYSNIYCHRHCLNILFYVSLTLPPILLVVAYAWAPKINLNTTYTYLPSILNIKHAGLHYFCLVKFVIFSYSTFHILALVSWFLNLLYF